MASGAYDIITVGGDLGGAGLAEALLSLLGVDTRGLLARGGLCLRLSCHMCSRLSGSQRNILACRTKELSWPVRVRCCRRRSYAGGCGI